MSINEFYDRLTVIDVWFPNRWNRSAVCVLLARLRTGRNVPTAVLVDVSSPTVLAEESLPHVVELLKLLLGGCGGGRGRDGRGLTCRGQTLACRLSPGARVGTAIAITVALACCCRPVCLRLSVGCRLSRRCSLSLGRGRSRIPRSWVSCWLQTCVSWKPRKLSYKLSSLSMCIWNLWTVQHKLSLLITKIIMVLKIITTIFDQDINDSQEYTQELKIFWY